MFTTLTNEEGELFAAYERDQPFEEPEILKMYFPTLTYTYIMYINYFYSNGELQFGVVVPEGEPILGTFPIKGRNVKEFTVDNISLDEYMRVMSDLI
jgi:hypothetical protein